MLSQDCTPEADEEPAKEWASRARRCVGLQTYLSSKPMVCEHGGSAAAICAELRNFSFAASVDHPVVVKFLLA